MNGIKRNTERLFSHGGKLFAMAMDLPQVGLVDGLTDPRAVIRSCKDSKLDAFLTNVGVAHLAEEELLKKKLILRTSSGGTNLATEFTGVQKNHVSPETALAMGADAVVMMMVIGGADYASIQDAAAAIDAYHRLSIPVVVEILAADYEKTQTFDIQANGARVAAELGADVNVAKRAGLLHDIGKSIDHEVEGSHVTIGVDICRKYKESEAVIHCIEAHHGDVEPHTIEACLVQAADAISAARPGARRENIENYVKRLEKLEEVSKSFPGIASSYAIQAGREIRIMVKPEEVSEDQMVLLARDIAKKIEEELTYPGQIKVHLLRETKAVDYAK